MLPASMGSSQQTVDPTSIYHQCMFYPSFYITSMSYASQSINSTQPSSPIPELLRCNSVKSPISANKYTHTLTKASPLPFSSSRFSSQGCFNSLITQFRSCLAARLLAHEVADLCLGKPPLRSLSVSATVGDALAALRTSEDHCISVWSCDHSKNTLNVNQGCFCIGKICMVDIICYLCREENLSSPSLALKSPVSALLSKTPGLVRHVEPFSSIVEAIDLILQGAQNLVVSIKSSNSGSSKRKLLQKSSSICPTSHNGHEFCWLTQEDVIRFLLNSIGLYSPIPTLSIDKLGIISSEFLTIRYHSPASSAIEAITESLANQTSVAVVDDEGILIGEISPFTLACCDEAVAAAITTLSAGDLMAYIDCGGPPEDIVRVVIARLKERNLQGMLEEFMIDSSIIHSTSSSSDEELPSPKTTLSRSGKYSRSSSYSARVVRRAEAIVCHPRSSLVAVMIQAIAHRVSYVWVIEDDGTLVGMVTFSNILEVFREHLESMA